MFSSHYAYATTSQQRLREVIDLTKRERMILALLTERGRITGADGGDFLEWTVHMKNPKPQGIGEDSPPEYNQTDSKRVAQLPWAWYHHGRKLDRLTVQTNKGKQAFINVITDAWNEVQQSFSQRWPEYFYQDGYNPPGGEPKPMYGFYSWFNQFVDDTAAAYQGFQGKVRICSGEYANLPLDLGNASSDWTGPDGSETVVTGSAADGTTTGQKWWPEGQGDAAYDFWHPLVIKCQSTSWGTSPAFNATYCEKMLDFGIAYSARTGAGDSGPIDVILSGVRPMLTIRERYASTYRTLSDMIPKPAVGAGNRSANMMGRAYNAPIYMYQGVFLVTDYDMPQPYDLIGLNLNNLAYRPVHNYDSVAGSTPLMDLVDDRIPGGMGQLIGAYSLGQLQMQSPRNSVIWDADLV